MDVDRATRRSQPESCGCGASGASFGRPEDKRLTEQIEREKAEQVGRREKPRPTICSKCLHFSWHPEYGEVLPHCMASRKSFVTNGSMSFHLCEEINTAGNCNMFEPAPPPKVHVSWWQRLKRFW